jgi:homocysteine S-methyltransferase
MTNPAVRTALPSTDTVVVTDAGLETWLLFDRGIELPSFAAYPLAGTDEGRAVLTEYYEHYVRIAASLGAAIELDAPTWRANPEWAETLGHDRDRLRELIGASVDVVREVRDGWTGDQPFLIGGAVGPRGDGYRIDAAMDAAEAASYHSFQIDAFATTPVDVVTAMTLCYADEAIGIARAAERAGLPVVISFTVETDGLLPSGMPLGEAVEATDEATGASPVHYMVNCAHPSHFAHVFGEGGGWQSRIGGIRANASSLSHAELDEALELDRGDPDDLAARYRELQELLPALHVVGGCCGTDHHHVEAIATAVCAR